MNIKARILIYFGLLLIAGLIVIPSFNTLRFGNPNPSGQDLSQQNKVAFPMILDRSVPLPAGGRFLFEYLWLGMKKAITFDKYDYNKIDRYGVIENNLYAPIFLKFIVHFSNTLYL